MIGTISLQQTKKISSVALAILFLLFTSSTAQAATYFLDSIGGSDNNTGTSETNAWKTLSELRELELQPGDIVYFKKGSNWDTGFAYGSITSNLGLELDDSGESGTPITYTTYGTGANPVFNNSYSSSPWVRAFTITGSFNVVENLTIKNAYEAGVYVTNTGSNNILKNLDISQTGYGVVLAGTYNRLENSRLYNTRMIINTNNGGGDDSGAIGVLLSGSFNTITKNVIENNLQPSYDFITDGAAVELYSQGTTVSNNTISYNTIKNNDTVTEVGGHSYPTISNNTFAYNLMINNSRVGLVHLNNGFKAVVTGLNFFNNTIYENTSDWSTNLENSRPKAYIFWSDVAPSANTMILKNNIFYLSGLERFSSHQSFTHDYNLYQLINGTQGITLNSNEINSNPFFVSPPSNFSLQAASLAINKGTLLSYNQDINGNMVPQGSAPDLGAYEYEATVIPSPTPTPTPSPSPTPTLTPTPSPSVSPSPTPACQADINQDGIVNLVDYSILSSHFFDSPPAVLRADINQDGMVNLLDYSQLSQHFMEEC